MSARGTLDALVIEIAAASRPVLDALSTKDAFTAFMAELGWTVTDFVPAISALKPTLQSIADAAPVDIDDAVDTPMLLGRMAEFFSALRSLSAANDLPSSIDAAAFRADFPGQLRDYLLFEHLLFGAPRIGRLLLVLGLLRFRRTEAASKRPAYWRREVAWSDLGRLLGDPTAVFSGAYNWGSSEFDGVSLLEGLYEFGSALGFEVSMGSLAAQQLVVTTKDARSDAIVAGHRALVRWSFTSTQYGAGQASAGVEVALLPETANDEPGIAILPYVAGSTSSFFPINDTLALEVSLGADAAGGMALLLRPGASPVLKLGFLNDAPSVGSDLELTLSTSRANKILLLGTAASSRLEAGSLSVHGGARARSGADSGSSAFVELELSNAALVISTGSSDGFLKKVLGDGATVDFSATLGLDSEQGFYFTGSSGLEIKIPAHITLGAVEVQSATVAIKPKDGVIPVDLTATVSVDLSVMKAVVENIGIAAMLTPRDDGNLGPFQFDIGFRPPTGIGVAVNASMVQGGGYLYFNKEREEYGGALELTINEVVAVKAIGLLNTRLPNGEKGFSLLVIMSAEFGTPLQLSFGFVLLGVGGMVGAHRATRTTPLLEGARTGAVNGILFPKDVVANAPKIFDNLRTIFPPEQGAFVVGPFLKLGWGTPPIVTLSLGILIQIPGDIVILGVLGAALPEDAPILLLQVAFVGVIEYSKKRLYFFAVLYDSNIVGKPLDGEMGVLAAFGDDANLVVTAGGFHPRYNPPALPFPKPARLSLEILNRSNAKIRAESYFCVTSNTVQLGVRAEAYFGFDAFKLDGDIRFDCLFRFSPFRFETDFSSSFDARVFGVGCFGISVQMALEGPTPWHAHGKGKISISLAPDISVCFSKTWGSDEGTTLPPVAVFPIVAAELARRENWQTSLAPGARLLVTLRTPVTSEAGIPVHPVGTLRVSQRVLPLDLTLDKFGNQTPTDLSTLSLTVSGGVMAKVTDALEQFASAQFQRLSDGEKLSRPGFEHMHGGVVLGKAGEQLLSARTVRRRVRYDTIIIDTKNRRSETKLATFPRALFNRFARNGSVGRSPFSRIQRDRLGLTAPRVKVQGERYEVTRVDTNKRFGSRTVAFTSESAAREFMNAQFAASPSLTGQLQVVPAYEAVP